jgi:hypothetical protein
MYFESYLNRKRKKSLESEVFLISNRSNFFTWQNNWLLWNFNQFQIEEKFLVIIEHKKVLTCFAGWIQTSKPNCNLSIVGTQSHSL